MFNNKAYIYLSYGTSSVVANIVFWIAYSGILGEQHRDSFAEFPNPFLFVMPFMAIFSIVYMAITMKKIGKEDEYYKYAKISIVLGFIGLSMAIATFFIVMI